MPIAIDAIVSKPESETCKTYYYELMQITGVQVKFNSQWKHPLSPLTHC